MNCALFLLFLIGIVVAGPNLMCRNDAYCRGGPFAGQHLHCVRLVDNSFRKLCFELPYDSCIRKMKPVLLFVTVLLGFAVSAPNPACTNDTYCRSGWYQGKHYYCKANAVDVKKSVCTALPDNLCVDDKDCLDCLHETECRSDGEDVYHMHCGSERKCRLLYDGECLDSYDCNWYEGCYDYSGHQPGNCGYMKWS
ncbi:unnamed protein product, partial [Mesorhabditis spiculigera]